LKTKIILSALALGATGLVLFGNRQVSGMNHIIQNLKTDIKKIRLKGVTGNNVRLSVDVDLINATSSSLNVPGKLVTVKTLRFFSPSGKYLGVADINLSNISIEANGVKTLQDIPVVISLRDITSSLPEILDIIKDSSTLVVKADVNAFGMDFTV
jgi:hypothetical protein